MSAGRERGWQRAPMLSPSPPGESALPDMTPSAPWESVLPNVALSPSWGRGLG